MGGKFWLGLIGACVGAVVAGSILFLVLGWVLRDVSRPRRGADALGVHLRPPPPKHRCVTATGESEAIASAAVAVRRK